MHVMLYNTDIARIVRQVVRDNPGRKIECIKQLRSYLGIGLKLAKDLVEACDTTPLDPVLAVLQAEDQRAEQLNPFRHHERDGLPF